MTREEAIKVLDSIKVKIDIPKAIKSQHQKNEAIDMAIEALNGRPKGECRTCKRCSDHCCETDEDFTRCPIEEHYALPKDGYCHLYQQI